MSMMPEQEIYIRTREPADLDGCVAALAAAHKFGGYPTNWPADPARWLAPSGTIHAWVAEIDASIAGHAILREPGFSTFSQTAVELSRLFVTPATRRRGVASALVQAAMRWAAARDLDLELEVTEHLQAARALYERSGFRLIGVKQAVWAAPDGAAVVLCHYAWSPVDS
jgi:GNAT superfamily N-acetyltransferase